ncbi:MAG: transporter ATPase [Ilumatobacteraceae bacterium]|nr:transporter ATPase [Ilumatobacteraceae bacterium]
MATTALVELRDVTKAYQLGDESFRALDQVHLSIDAGDFVAVTGPSGSGKSTLANVIGGLDRPTHGQVVVAGEDLAGMGDGALSRFRIDRIGFVFQSFNLKADGTALENVMLPLVFARVRPKERRARAAACLELVGLKDRMGHRPSQLSGGQRQRVAIARALVTDPRLLIADEPTGNLDSARGEEVMDLLASLGQAGTTLLVITHDPTVASRAGRTIEVRDGKVLEAVR